MGREFTAEMLVAGALCIVLATVAWVFQTLQTAPASLRETILLNTGLELMQSACAVVATLLLGRSHVAARVVFFVTYVLASLIASTLSFGSLTGSTLSSDVFAAVFSLVPWTVATALVSQVLAWLVFGRTSKAGKAS